MENLVRRVNKILDAISWLILVGAAALVYNICNDLGVELYHLLR